jgi:hypothetical protein
VLAVAAERRVVTPPANLAGLTIALADVVEQFLAT